MSTSTSGDAAENPSTETEASAEASEAGDDVRATDGSETSDSEPEPDSESASEPEPEHASDAASDAESAPAVSLEEAQASIEALLYAASSPLSLRELKKAFPEAPELVSPVLEKLASIYGEDGRGVQLVEVAGGWQITTRPAYHEVVGRLVAAPKPARLSLQALETLAVIAYRQPVTVPEIMELRGVNSAGVVRTLLERKLIKIAGRKNVVGRPLLYATTKEFLLRFGLNNLKDLPQLKDLSEVFGDDVAGQLEVLEALEPSGGSETETETETQTEVETKGEGEEASEQAPPTDA